MAAVSTPFPWDECHEHDRDQEGADASRAGAAARGPVARADQLHPSDGAEAAGGSGHRREPAFAAAGQPPAAGGRRSHDAAQRRWQGWLRLVGRRVGHADRGLLERRLAAGGLRDLDRFPWPDPDVPGLLEEAAEAISADGGEHFVAPNFGMCLFERAWSLRGFTAFLMDLVDDPDWAAELLDRITDIQVRLAQRFVALGIDGGYLGDDYGAQRGMLFSPKLWRQHFKPRLAGSSPSSARPDCR